MSNICFKVRPIPCIFDGMWIFWVILSHEYRCFHGWRHEHSPNHRTFVNVLHWIFWRMVQHLSQSIIQSISSSLMTNLSSTGLTVLAPTFHQISHSWRGPLFVNVPFWVFLWASAQYGSPRTCLLHIKRAQRYLTFRFGSLRAFWCTRGKQR